MKIVNFFAKYVFLALLVFSLVKFSTNYRILIKFTEFKLLFPFIISGVIFLIILLVIPKKFTHFWVVFTHELTHVFLAVITFNHIEGFSASLGGGVTSYTGRSNWLIRLAPYFFPLYAVFLILINLMIRTELTYYLNHLIIISYVFFLFTLFKCFSYREPDIKKTGYIFSTLFIITFNLLFLLFLSFYLQGRISVFWTIFVKGVLK